jgi:hypothetical protein
MKTRIDKSTIRKIKELDNLTKNSQMYYNKKIKEIVIKAERRIDRERN